MNTKTILVLILVILVVGCCLFSLLRRLTGRKSCCETTAPKVKPKKLKAPIGRVTVEVDGLRCQSCCRTLAAKLNALEGVSAKVSLENRTAVVSYERPLEDSEIAEAVESAGFGVMEMKRSGL